MQISKQNSGKLGLGCAWCSFYSSTSLFYLLYFVFFSVVFFSISLLLSLFFVCFPALSLEDCLTKCLCECDKFLRDCWTTVWLWKPATHAHVHTHTCSHAYLCGDFQRHIRQLLTLTVPANFLHIHVSAMSGIEQIWWLNSIPCHNSPSHDSGDVSFPYTHVFFSIFRANYQGKFTQHTSDHKINV